MTKVELYSAKRAEIEGALALALAKLHKAEQSATGRGIVAAGLRVDKLRAELELWSF